MKRIISPSLLASDFSKFGEEINRVKNGGAGMIHIDVMDGVFVPNINFGIPLVSSLRSCSDIIFDVHLMISRPQDYIKQFAEAGADIITFHAESNTDILETTELIKSCGKKASVSLSPNTDASVILPYLPKLDMVLCMTVYPGFGGQKFIPCVLDKVRTIRKYADEHGLSPDIEVDGGISPDNVALCYQAGANVIVAGSSIFHAEDPAAVIEQMLNI